MSDKREIDDLSVDELKELLYLKRRAGRQKRLRRMKAEGRLVEYSDIVDHDLLESESEEERHNGTQCDAVEDKAASEKSDESTAAAPTAQMPLFESWVVESYAIDDEESDYGDIDRDTVIDFVPAPQSEEEESPKKRGWRPFANRVLLLVEIGAVVGLVILAYIIWQTTKELNLEIAEAQESSSVGLFQPTPDATPLIGVVVLPSGHKPPVNGMPPEPGEAGEIPAHLLPLINAYVPPPIPTPGPEQARRLQIPSLNLDKPIVQGDSWEELKKGVGQQTGSGRPGEPGNVVLSAHNDIYGEIFRHLDQLESGDEVIISSERQSYTYIVRDVQVVRPTDVWVMDQTEYPSATLISCYPYLVNNKRIVVFADLATSNPLNS
jgi:sortase A